MTQPSSRAKTWLAVLIVSSSVAMPARAMVCPPVAEGMVMLSNAAMKVSVEMLFSSLFDQLSGQILNFGKQKVTALKTLTAQVATSAKAKINSDVALSQGSMAAVGYLERSRQQLRVYQEFSAATGQGVDPCLQLKTQTNLTVASGQTAAMAAEALEHVAAAPGRFGNMERYIDQLLGKRRTLFGTDDEARLGLGVASKASVVTSTGERFSLAGADSNARVLFVESSDPLVLQARDAYLNRMAGPPDRAISKEAANLPAGKEYLAAKARKDAAMSAAMNSLATVGAENTPNAELGGKSKSQTMREVVGLYYGKDAQDRWQGWASQDQRGLLVDQAKIAAANLAVEADLYMQARRQEALVSALLAVEASSDSKAAIDAAAQALEGQRARPSLR